MRIALLTSSFYQTIAEIQGQDRIVFGGAERYAVELARLVRDMGHTIDFYQALPIPAGDTKQYQQVVKDYKGIAIHCLPVAPGGWRYGGNTELNAMFNQISASTYDLRIYFMTAWGFPHIVNPAITISHGIYWDDPQGEYRTLPEDSRKEFWRRNLYGFTAPDVCVSVDSNVRKVIQAIEPGAESHIHVIPNFVDTSQFKPRQKPKDWERTRVLFPQRLAVLRGSNDFLEASRRYQQYDYIACGQGDEAAIDDWMAKYAETTPNLNVMWQPMERMPAVYRQADIAALPNRASAGLALGLLESMASGLPVITTRTGGLGDAVIEGYNALAYDPNRDSLGEYICVLAEDRDMREKFGRRNREIAVESFDISIWRARWEKLLRQFGG